MMAAARIHHHRLNAILPHAVIRRGMATAPVEAPVAVAPAPVTVPIVAPVQTPVAAPATSIQKPLVDETDWRVTRPASKPVVRAAEPAARPVAARPAMAAEARSPNLFQRITGAFAAPKPGMAAPVEPQVRAAENVVAVTPKPALARPAPVQTTILEVTERTKPARDDDDLQITAFLRRQAN